MKQDSIFQVFLRLLNRAAIIRHGAGKGLRIRAQKMSGNYIDGRNELCVQEVLAQHLSRGDVFYDVGANVGFFSLMAARLVGVAGIVYAFEPVPANLTVLTANISLNQFKNIIVVPKAVARNNSRLHLIITQHPGGAKLATVGTPLNSRIKTVVPVDVISLDEWLQESNARPPTLVKIDVEGAEFQVIQGMQEIIRCFRPKIVYEIDHPREDSLQEIKIQLDVFFQRLGYRVTHLEDAYPHIRWHVHHALAQPL
jgi:FkbM family methyltransferase